VFAGKEVRVLLKGQAKESYLELKKRDDKESVKLVNSIQRIIDILKETPQFGNPIEKRKIPKEYIKQGIKNLYRCELSNYWRLIYTLEGTRVEIFTFVLNIMDHKKYNRLFGYKKN
jgi:Txe/YoeB family toxin of Txe-Axe toxin-antitoxin module